MYKNGNVPSASFGVRQTHGILRRAEHKIEQSSDRLGWSSLYVSRQYEQPYEEAYKPVQDHLVILHLDGPVRVERRLDGKLEQALVEPGGMFSMPGGADFWVHLAHPLHSIHFYIRDAVLREVASDHWLGDPGRITLRPCLGEVDPIVGNITRAASHALDEQEGNSQLLADCLARALASRLLIKSMGSPAASCRSGAVLDQAQQRRLREFVATHLAYPIGLADLASVVGLTPTRFARGFKRDTGSTPYQYVLVARLQCAKMLLRTTSVPIAEIAVRCGFSHQEHLTRMFRRETGATPAAYRRSFQS